jgi:hypothetical protein
MTHEGAAGQQQKGAAMKALMTLGVVAAMVGLLAAGAPLRADEEDCETVLTDLTEAISIANKNFETMMDELKKMSQSADSKTRATIKNRFCSASGELLGTSRATRAVAGECGPKHSGDLAAFDKSIKEMETAIDDTCK